MKRFTTATWMLIGTALPAIMAQPPAIRVGTSYGAIAVPSFLPPALDPSDPVSYWTGTLGLDLGQQTSLKTILADRETAAKALRTQLDQARAALAAGAKADSSDPEIDQLSAGLGSVFAQAVAVEAKMYARFYALLTPDQKQKLDKLMAFPAGATLSVQGFAAVGAAGNQ